MLGYARIWVLRETVGQSVELKDCVVLCTGVGDDIRDREVGWYGMWHVWVEESSTRWTRWKETTWKTLVEMGDNIKIYMKYV